MQPVLWGYMIKEHMLINTTLFSYSESPCDLAEAHLQHAHAHARLIQMAPSHHNQVHSSIFNPVIKKFGVRDAVGHVCLSADGQADWTQSGKAASVGKEAIKV